MSDCDFQTSGAEFTCSVCGYVANKRVVRKCHGGGRPRPAELTAEDVPCPFRGDQLRVQRCKKCGGYRDEPVYRCSQFGECAIRSVRGVKSCLRCEFLPGE